VRSHGNTLKQRGVALDSRLRPAISYHYIEKPLRKYTWSENRLISIGYGAVGATFAFLFIFFIVKPLGGYLYMGKQLDLQAVGVGSLTNEYSLDGDFNWKGNECVLSDNNQVGKIIDIKDCTLGDYQNAVKRVLVVGNSFSAAFVQAFDELVKNDGFAVTITSSWGASPVKEIINNGAWNKANDYYWEHVIPSLIGKLKPGDWVLMINDMAGFSPAIIPQENKSDSLSLLTKGLEQFSNELAKRNINLAVLHGNPFAREAKCQPSMAIKQWFKPFDDVCNFISKRESLLRREPLDKTLKQLESERMIKVIDLMDIFCPRLICDYMSADNKMLYRDEWSHPSIEAARLSAPIIRQALINSYIPNK
jgi:hypothetical protein